MPTLFTALLARKGAMPKPQILPGSPIPKPTFAANLFSESVVGARPTERPGATAIVIGGGFAGLAAANELFHAGYRVTVLEAQPRLGGRVLSLTDVVSGKVVEGGGELIGDNHPAWLSYAAKFGLEFSPVHDGENAPIFLRGRRLKKRDADALGTEMAAIFEHLARLAGSIPDPHRPWLSPSAPLYEHQSLASWIEGIDASPLAKYAVDLQFATDDGVTSEKQSLLGILAMIQGGRGMDYFVATERHRCVGGNQQLAAKLAEPLASSVRLGFRVGAIHKTRGGLSVRGVEWTKHPDQVITLEGRDVILAVPPSVWPEIEFDQDFPTLRRPQMGANVKCLMTFESEFWKKAHFSPNLTSDYPMQLTWDATEEQPGPGHVLVGFSGASQAEKCARWTPVERTGRYAKEVARAYTGCRPELRDARLKNWPEDPFVKASYAFPAPGEITKWGPFLEQGIGNLHFAGEHTCYAFIGYMEGALQSGIRAANRVMVRDGLANPIA